MSDPIEGEPKVEPTPEPGEPKPAPEIDPERYAAANRDLMKYKSQSRDKDSEIEKLREQIKSQETTKLETKEEYKKLYETTKEHLARVEKEKKDLVNNIYLNEKLGRIESTARKAGMNEDQVKDLGRYPEYIDMVETETTERGRIMVEGVDAMIEKVRQDRPTWFSKGRAPNLNTANPDNISGTKKYSQSDLLALELKDPAEYKKVMKKLYPQLA